MKFTISTVLILFFATNTFYAKAQEVFLNAFHLNYYSQNSNFKALGYQDFFGAASFSALLPSQSQYQVINKDFLFQQKGLNFGFEVQLQGKKQGINSKHFAQLDFRNGFVKAVETDQVKNSIFILHPLLIDSLKNYPNYSIRVDAENFGISLAYKYQILKTKKIQAFLGSQFLYDIAISKKLKVTPLDWNNEDTLNITAINHNYFLQKSPNIGANLFFQVDYQIFERIAIQTSYHFGTLRFSLEGLHKTGTNQIFELGLKFKL